MNIKLLDKEPDHKDKGCTGVIIFKDRMISVCRWSNDYGEINIYTREKKFWFENLPKIQSLNEVFEILIRFNLIDIFLDEYFLAANELGELAGIRKLQSELKDLLDIDDGY